MKLFGRARSVLPLQYGALAHAVPAAPGSNMSAIDGGALNGAPTAARPVTSHEITNPAGGLLSNFRVRIDAAFGAGVGVTYTVYVNEIATAITVTISGAAQVNASDDTNSVVVAQGDRVYVHMDRQAGVPGAVGMRASLGLAA